MLFIIFKNVHTHHQIPGYATGLSHYPCRWHYLHLTLPLLQSLLSPFYCMWPCHCLGDHLCSYIASHYTIINYAFNCKKIYMDIFLLQIIAFIVAMTGIIMITYMDAGITINDLWGSVLALVATAGAAAYKVKSSYINTSIAINDLWRSVALDL